MRRLILTDYKQLSLLQQRAKLHIRGCILLVSKMTINDDTFFKFASDEHGFWVRVDNVPLIYFIWTFALVGGLVLIGKFCDYWKIRGNSSLRETSSVHGRWCCVKGCREWIGAQWWWCCWWRRRDNNDGYIVGFLKLYIMWIDNECADWMVVHVFGSFSGAFCAG